MFRTLSRQLIIPIAAAITVGLLAVVFFYSLSQQNNILQQNERSIHKLTNSIVHGLQTIMLAGYADVAELFVERLQTIEGIVDFRILRTDGLESFKDNKTIEKVNRVRGDEHFTPRDNEKSIIVLPKDFPSLKETLAKKQYVKYYETKNNERTLTILWPILNEKTCRKCHGGDHEVRGILKLTTSLKSVDNEVERTWQTAAVITALSLLIIIVAMSFIVRRWVVSPIKEVSLAMSKASDGDLSQNIPVIGRDELADMATNFNTMQDELRATYSGFKIQHNKLETIIQGSRDGIVVTDHDNKIVLINAAAKDMLGKTDTQLSEEGFSQLFNDPDRLHGMLANSAGDSEVIAFNSRFLVISAASIHTDDGRLIGSAAMLRDITEEKRMERALRTLSDTDGLTGLANRRMLDDSLTREVNRCLENGRPLSILMFDVDHFKKFNDTYGHDQGDRVLKHVAQATRNSVREIDIPCRYGGEEFVVILIETAEEGALTAGERTRSAIESMRVDGLQVTTTIGIAGLAETGAKTPEELIACADAAMYEGKHAGRNRVVVAGRMKREA